MILALEIAGYFSIAATIELSVLYFITEKMMGPEMSVD